MNIVILSAQNSWINPFIERLLDHLKGHDIAWRHEPEDLSGDVCFLLSWERIVPTEFRKRFGHILIVHASDLPEGRGMSPLTWQILEGRNEITVSLLAAEDKVDCGDIYAQERLVYKGNELLAELQKGIGEATINLCAGFVQRLTSGFLTPRPQVGEPTYYRWRKSEDSRFDPEKSIASQFDLFRVVDNEKYPAFFEHRGRRYRLKIYVDD